MSHRAAQCQHVIDRFTGILNAPANLIGVDAIIIMLKKELLQNRGPSNWNLYELCVYVVTGDYLHAVTNKWNMVVHQLAEALDAVAHEQGLKLESPVSSPNLRRIDSSRPSL